MRARSTPSRSAASPRRRPRTSVCTGRARRAATGAPRTVGRAATRSSPRSGRGACAGGAGRRRLRRDAAASPAWVLARRSAAERRREAGLRRGACASRLRGLGRERTRVPATPAATPRPQRPRPRGAEDGFPPAELVEALLRLLAARHAELSSDVAGGPSHGSAQRPCDSRRTTRAPRRPSAAARELQLPLRDLDALTLAELRVEARAERPDAAGDRGGDRSAVCAGPRAAAEGAATARSR